MKIRLDQLQLTSRFIIGDEQEVFAFVWVVLSGSRKPGKR
jgi:hypothetical protein